MSDKGRILLVEDTGSLAAIYVGYLARLPYQVTHVGDGRAALEHLEREVPEIILLDLQLPDMNGMDVLRFVEENALASTVIMITAHGSVEQAVEAIRLGAFDFLAKPFDANRLLVTVANAFKHRKLNEVVDTYRSNFDRSRYHGFIGSSLEMQAVYRIIESVATSKASVFITGESGTGKELCAAALHLQSQRAGGPFIALNCAAIPRELVESEVFGHIKGAFTGAASNRDGAATRADGGTLFLDEVCEMDMDLQTKLLRFVQTGTFQRVGASKEEHVDVRFVCATNRDPLAEVSAGRFREDLYYRLHVIPIAMPPLRSRGNDILAIARNFLKDYSREEGRAFDRFASECERMLLAYDWPGNVRQLQNVVRNIVVLNSGEVVTPEMLPPPLNSMPRALTVAPAAVSAPSGEGNVPAGQDESSVQPLWLVEKQAIDRAIACCDGNIPRAATLLEISPSTIYRKLQSWEQQGHG